MDREKELVEYTRINRFKAVNTIEKQFRKKLKKKSEMS